MRILITGPECTGKSTLARQLSEKLSLPWFPEYARTYLEQNGPNYNQDDILKIAKAHFHLVETFSADQPLILDTYLLNLKIWTEYKYLQTEPWVDQRLLAMTPPDYVFLLSPDLPWKQDGLRESEGQRTVLFELYSRQLTNLRWNYNVITGVGRARLDAVMENLE